jgi:plastocyanin
MRKRASVLVSLAGAAAGVFVIGEPAPLAEPAPPTAADFARLEAELARVQQDLRDQRQLILQLMQMHDALLKYVGSGGGNTAGYPPPGLPPPSGAGRGPAAGGAREASPSVAAAEGSPGGGSGSGSVGSISGKVHVSGGDLSEVYVYVDGGKSVPSHPPTVEIKQRSKQFVPSVAVVPVGAKVLFPNEDKIFHNVFSTTPGDAFDLGTVKSGDKPSPVVLLKPGHVEVFCNIHSKMRADILVVPNQHWTRVHPDGTFQISGVPLGSKRIVLWGPGIKPVMQKVDVTPGGATATLTAEASSAKPHLNKQGGAYGSYDD